ncbi:MAG: hypothetical protein K9L88_07735 [Chromatiaceae bacterium]|nr:hypothetical protein [Chromatiaceae bacterium]
MTRAKKQRTPDVGPQPPAHDHTLALKLKAAFRAVSRARAYAVMLTRTRRMDGEESPFTSDDIEALAHRFDEYNHRIATALASDDDETRRAEVEALERELGPLEATNENAI